MTIPRELPRYVCHKEVQALKIDTITYSDKGAKLYPVDPDYAPIDVDLNFLEKHRPEAAGYYVVYQDGYASYSPAAAFEGGYTLKA